MLISGTNKFSSVIKWPLTANAPNLFLNVNPKSAHSDNFMFINCSWKWHRKLELLLQHTYIEASTYKQTRNNNLVTSAGEAYIFIYTKLTLHSPSKCIAIRGRKV